MPILSGSLREGKNKRKERLNGQTEGKRESMQDVKGGEDVTGPNALISFDFSQETER